MDSKREHKSRWLGSVIVSSRFGYDGSANSEGPNKSTWDRMWRISAQAGRPITTKLSPTGKTVLCRNSLWGKDFEGVCKFGEYGEPGEALAAT